MINEDTDLKLYGEFLVCVMTPLTKRDQQGGKVTMCLVCFRYQSTPTAVLFGHVPSSWIDSKGPSSGHRAVVCQAGGNAGHYSTEMSSESSTACGQNTSQTRYVYVDHRFSAIVMLLMQKSKIVILLAGPIVMTDEAIVWSRVKQPIFRLLYTIYRVKSIWVR